MARFIRGALLVAAVSALLATPAAAQVANGEVFGRVVDATNAAVPGVTVTLESPALLRPQTAVTTRTGAYRFVQVPIGTYSVTFGLTGFRTVKREGIRIQTGFSAEINVKLQVSSIEETVTVSGAPPVVDTKAVNTGAVFDRQTLDAIPTARDPWVVLNMVPGVVMSGVNVGGSTSGQQMDFEARGEGRGAAMWNVDGVTTTDMAATGASPQYYDFDAYEEIQVTTGGSDVSVQTGGININLVSKSGSNVFKGTSRAAFADANLQWNNVSREMFYGGGSLTNPLSGAPMKRNYEVGIEAGGPLVRNQLWWWGAFARQDINSSVVGFFKTTPECTPVPNTFEQIKDTWACMHDDRTILTNYHGKLNYQLNAGNKFAFLYNFSDKDRNARGASVTRPPETTHHQHNSKNPLDAFYNVKHTWIATDRLVFENSLEYTRSGFTLDFQDPKTQHDLQPLFEDDTNTYRRSYQLYDTSRPTTEIKTDGTYFLSNVLGGDHALKFGLRYRDTPWTTYTHWGGDAIAQIDDLDGNPATPLEPEFAYLYRDRNETRDFYTVSAYLQDSYSKGRLRLNLGVRWDYQDDATAPSSVNANSIIPDILPGISFPGYDAGITWNDISPRISATYDLFGTGKTVLKGTYAFYFDQGGLYSGASTPVDQVSIRMDWNDANGDRFIQRNELNMDPSTWSVSGNFDIDDPTNPTGQTTLDTIDPNLSNDRTREFIGGIEHELMDNFGVGVSYIHRIYDRGNFTRIIGLTQDHYEAVDILSRLSPAQIANLPPGVNFEGRQYWRIVPGTMRFANVDHRTNDPGGVNSVYRGVEVTARKRFSNRWQLNGSFTWNDDRDYGTTSFIHTNDVTRLRVNQANYRWVSKLNGSYQLPAGFNLSANLNLQDGIDRLIQYRLPFRDRTSATSTGTSNLDIDVEPEGTTHLPVLKMMDLSLDKNLDFGNGRRLNLSVAVFNLFNVSTIRGYASNRMDSSAFNRVSSIVPPRIARFMVRLHF